ncbi:hypothetical protein Tco_0535686 [Tanacetum coccineum]
MVKLAMAREVRMYGSRRSRKRAEYTNAGLYLFSTIVLLCRFVAQFSSEAKSGLVVILIGIGLIIVVNIHDMFAHLAGIDYRLRLIELARVLKTQKLPMSLMGAQTYLPHNKLKYKEKKKKWKPMSK